MVTAKGDNLVEPSLCNRQYDLSYPAFCLALVGYDELFPPSVTSTRILGPRI